MARHFHPLKIVMAYRLGHGKSTYRCTTSASVMELKNWFSADCSALRYWESGTEGGRVSVVSGDRNRIEFQLELAI